MFDDDTTDGVYILSNCLDVSLYNTHLRVHPIKTVKAGELRSVRHHHMKWDIRLNVLMKVSV
jgi:hypothetical protein